MADNESQMCPPSVLAHFQQRRIVSLDVIDLSLDACAAYIERWLRGSSLKWAFHWEALEISRICPIGQEYCPKREKLVAWAPTCLPRCAAFLSNLQAWFGPVGNAAIELGVRAIKVRLSVAPNEEICELEVLIDGSIQRFIRVLHDTDRWEFFQQGTPLPFEDQRAYHRRRIRDRFTAQMLADYCRQFGFPIDRDDFWTSGPPAFVGESMIATRTDTPKA